MNLNETSFYYGGSLVCFCSPRDPFSSLSSQLLLSTRNRPVRIVYCIPSNKFLEIRTSKKKTELSKKTSVASLELGPLVSFAIYYIYISSKSGSTQRFVREILLTHGHKDRQSLYQKK